MIDELIPEYDGSAFGRPDLIVVFPEGVITPPREEILEDLLAELGLVEDTTEAGSHGTEGVRKLLLSSAFLSMSEDYFVHALSEQLELDADTVEKAITQVLSPDHIRSSFFASKSRAVYHETVDLLTRIGELFPLFLWNDLPDFVLNPLVADRNNLFSRCIRRKFAPGQPSLSDAVEELIGGNEASNPLFIAWNPQVLYPLVGRGLDAIVHADAERLRRELVLRGVSLSDIRS
ncbi:MAG: hypothetical protein ACLFNQ_04780 [Spirochaetaceae bacterium]